MPNEAGQDEVARDGSLCEEAPAQAAADDWVAVLTERLRDCPGVVLVAPDTKRQQVESQWTHAVFLVERAEGEFRWSQRGATGLGWLTATGSLATIDELLPKMRLANDLAAEVAKSKPTPVKAVSYWERRATRLARHLLSQARDATERLHRDLGEADDETEGVDLEDVAARAAAIADTLRVLAAP